MCRSVIGRHHARPHTLHRHQRTLLLHLHTRSALSTSKQHCQPPIGGCIKLSLSECGPKCLATRGGLLCSRGTARPGWPTPIGFACPPELARPAWFLTGVRHTLGRRSARVARMRNETSNKSIKFRLYQELCRSNGPVGGFEGWCHKMGQSRGSALEVLARPLQSRFACSCYAVQVHYDGHPVARSPLVLGGGGGAAGTRPTGSIGLHNFDTR